MQPTRSGKPPEEGTSRVVAALKTIDTTAGKAASSIATATAVLGAQFIPGLGKMMDTLANVRLAMGKLGGTGLGLAVAVPVAAIAGAIEGVKSLGAACLSLSASVNPGGFKIFEEALSLATARLGQEMGPLLPLLAAGVLTLADKLRDEFLPIIQQIPSIIANVVIPAIKMFIEWCVRMANKLAGFVMEAGSALETKRQRGIAEKQIFAENKGLERAYNQGRVTKGLTGIDPGGIVAHTESMIHKRMGDNALKAGTKKEGDITPSSPEQLMAAWGKEMQGIEANKKAKEDKDAKDAEARATEAWNDANRRGLSLEERNENVRKAREKPDTFAANLKLIMSQQQRNLAEQYGVKPGFSGLADVWKQVQARSMLKPFETEMLKRFNDANLALQRLNDTGKAGNQIQVGANH